MKPQELKYARYYTVCLAVTIHHGTGTGCIFFLPVSQCTWQSRVTVSFLKGMKVKVGEAALIRITQEWQKLKCKEGSHDLITQLLLTPTGNRVWCTCLWCLKLYLETYEALGRRAICQHPHQMLSVESCSSLFCFQIHMKRCWARNTLTTWKVYVCIWAFWGHVVAMSPSCRQPLKAFC